MCLFQDNFVYCYRYYLQFDIQQLNLTIFQFKLTFANPDLQYSSFFEIDLIGAVLV